MIVRQRDKKFAVSHNLKLHERIHTAEKPFCWANHDKKFSDSSNLKIHEMICTGDKPFICSHCNKKFAWSGTLNIHVRLSELTVKAKLILNPNLHLFLMSFQWAFAKM